jgi:tetratricopeptide (TPR) repeat protein
VEWVTLGAAVAKIVMRAYSQSDAIDWATVADQVDDAQGAFLGLSGRRRPQAPPEERLGRAIGTRIEAELRGQLGHARLAARDDELENTVNIVADVVAGLIRSDRRETADKALIKALAYPDELYTYVRQNGGDRARRNFVAERAEPIYDRILEAACQELTRLAPTAAQTTAAALTELLRRLDAQTEQLERLQDSSRLDQETWLAVLPLPPYLAEEIGARLDRMPRLVQLAEVIANDDQPAQTLGRWLTHAPPWLADGSADGWVILGHALGAFGSLRLAADAYRRAIAEGAPRPDELEAWAAMVLLDAGAENDARVGDLIDGNSTPLAAWIRAARAQLWSEAADAAKQLPEATPRHRETKTVLLAQALARCGDTADAIAVLREAASSAVGSGIPATLAGHLLSDAVRGRRPSRGSALLEALDWALQAREQRRRWNGDSVEPALVAFEAAWQVGDRDQAWQIVTAAPEGSATAREAADPRMQVASALAAAGRGDDQFARELAVGFRPFDRLRVHAELDTKFSTDRDRIASASLWRAVWDAAETDQERLIAARGLCLYGGTVEGLEALRQREPEAMREIDQMAHAISPRSGEGRKGRMFRLRRNSKDNIHAAVELGWMLAEDGKRRDAASVLSEAADRFDDQRWRLEAAALLFRADDYGAARKTAENALSVAGDRWPGRLRAHSIALDSAAADGDWEAVVTHARQLLDMTDDPEVRWALAHGLVALEELEAAWHVVHFSGSGILKPLQGSAGRQQTVLRVQLASRFGSESDLMSTAVEALRSYGDDEELAATVIGMVYTSEARRPPDANRIARNGGASAAHAPADNDLGAEFATLSGEFLKRFPDSTYLRAINFENLDDPEALVAKLKPLLADRSAVLADFHPKVRAGQLPFGFLAAVTGRAYAEMHIVAAREGHIIRFDDPAIDKVELAAVTRVVEGATPTFLDASVLHMLTYLSDQTRADCVEVLTSLKITRAAYSDLQQTLSSLALRSTAMLGYDNATQRPTLIEVDQATANWRADKARELVDLARAVADVADGADAKIRRGLDLPV